MILEKSSAYNRRWAEGEVLVPFGESSVAPWQLNVCSCFGTAHFNLRMMRSGLRFSFIGLVHFIDSIFFEPAQSQIACSFLRRFFK
jgi:hypothetical protein